MINFKFSAIFEVTRAFGNIQHKTKHGSSCIEPVPDIHSFNFVSESGIEFLIAATDGLWDVMGCQEVVNFVRQNLPNIETDEIIDVDEIARKLVKEALRCGSVDNISVVLLFFNFDDSYEK